MALQCGGLRPDITAVTLEKCQPRHTGLGGRTTCSRRSERCVDRRFVGCADYVDDNMVFVRIIRKADMRQHTCRSPKHEFPKV